MDVKIETMKQDWVTFYFAQLFRNKKERVNFFIRASLPPVIFIALALIVVFQFESGRWRTAALWLSFFSVSVYASLFYLMTRRKLNQRVESLIETGQRVIGTSEISLSQEGVTVARDSKLIFKTWKEITRVTANGNYGFIFAGSDAVTIIPCRCFPDHTSFEMFVKSAVIFQWHAENAIKAAMTAPKHIPLPVELKPLVIPMS